MRLLIKNGRVNPLTAEIRDYPKLTRAQALLQAKSISSNLEMFLTVLLLVLVYKTISIANVWDSLN